MISKNNQIFRQRMSTLAAENTQLKSDLEALRKDVTTISEERDALKASVPTGSTSESLADDLERLRQEKDALEQALQEEKLKQPAQTNIPTTSDLEAQLVC
jgi:hypothetical protein